MLKPNEKNINVEEYFAREVTAEYKSEYYCGDIFAMAGGTPNHNRIIVNLAGVLNSQFKGKPCEAFASELKVQVEKGIHYTYPDIAVVCGEIKLLEGRSDTILNPILIAEVLSDSTKDYDRGTKFTAYRSIKTLSEYILIEQDNVHIEYFSKEIDGTWRLREYLNINDSVNIESIQVNIFLKDIYARVDIVSKARLIPCP